MLVHYSMKTVIDPQIVALESLPEPWHTLYFYMSAFGTLTLEKKGMQKQFSNHYNLLKTQNHKTK